MTNRQKSAPISPARGWLIICVLAAASLTSSLQFTLMVPILPEVPAVFNVQPDDAAWVIIITLLTSTVSTAIVSRMADLYGRKRMLIIALGFLCAGSLIAALSMSFTAVIIGRAMQGLATGIVPIGISLIHTHVNTKQATMGVALLSGTIGFGSALGLPLSGVLMTTTGMSGIFWSSCAASAVFIVAVFVFVPEAPERLQRKLDPTSTVLLAVWLTAVTLLISKAASWGIASPLTISMAVLSLVAFLSWVRVSMRTPNAVIDVRLAMTPQMFRINLASFLATFGMFANHLLTIQEARAPIENEIGLGLPVTQAGLILLPSALSMMLLAPVSGAFMNRYGPGAALATGTVVMSLGFAFRALFHGSFAEVLTGTIIVGIGVAFAFASMPALVTAASPPSEHASANGVNALIRSLSGAIASASYALILVAFAWARDPLYISNQGLTLAFTVVCATCLAAAIVATPMALRGVRR